VTDAALTAQTVETPCTPLAAAFLPLIWFSFCGRCDWDGEARSRAISTP